MQKDSPTASSDLTKATASRGISFKRTVSLIKFYRPMIEKQTLAYVIFSAIAGIVILLPLNGYAQVGLYTIFWTILGYMASLSPCILAKSGDSRIIERLIPVPVREKYIFRIVYFLIYIPIICSLLPFCAILLYKNMPTLHTDMFDQIIAQVTGDFENSLSAKLSNLFTSWACILTCLYVVTRVRTNRIIKGILSVFGIQIVMGTLGALCGFSMAFNEGFLAGIEGTSYNPDETTQQLVNQVFHSSFFYFTTGLTILYVIVMLILNYRILKKHNL